MKYWPILVFSISFIGMFYTLQNRVANAEDKIKNVETSQVIISKDTADIKISQAKTETKLESILDILKDLKRENHV